MATSKKNNTLSVVDTAALSRELHNLLTLMSPLQDFGFRSYTVYHRLLSDDTEGEKLPRFEHERIWSTFLDEAWQARFLFYKASDYAEKAVRLLSDSSIMESEQLTEILTCSNSRMKYLRKRVREYLSKYKVDPLVVEAIERELDQADGDWQKIFGVDSLQDVVDLVKNSSSRFDQHLRRELLPARTPKQRREAVSKMIPEGNPEISIRCEWLEGDFRTFCQIIAIAIIIVVIISVIIEAVGDFIDWLDEDNEVRDHVNGQTCEELKDTQRSSIVNYINIMLEGATLNDDEQTILRILDCLPCEEVQEVVEQVGLSELLNNFHGDEWDSLMLRLQRCNIVSFADWDDDVTRKFVTKIDCNTINDFSLSQIRQLIQNMLSGATLNADEDAILDIIGCLSCAKLKQLMNLPDMDYNNLEKNFHGDQWDNLLDRFNECDISDPDDNIVEDLWNQFF